jgi:hypothetical protein
MPEKLSQQITNKISKNYFMIFIYFILFGLEIGRITASGAFLTAVKRGLVRISVNGSEVRVPEGTTVAAAVAVAGIVSYRRSVHGEARAPLCGMGICYECRVTIDGQRHVLSCQTECAEGMRVVTE